VKARLIRSYEIAPQVRHFEFEVADVERFDFATGQFVSLSAVIGGKEITRAYSLASVPNGNRFELCLNLVGDGHFSPLLFTMQPGDEVNFAGPVGYFVWRKPVGEAILVATGTGIAPFRGMLQQRFSSGIPAKVHLVFGVRYESHLMYRDEFAAMARDHAEFSFWPVLSRPEPSWSGRTGHVQEHVMEALGERRDVDVYICGLKAMVDDLRGRLKAAGLDRKRLVYEKYD
jgi:CDP-4-dehydro-6-deoxyglucose reductase